MKLQRLVYEDKDEYLNVFTNKQTAKRIKLEDLSIFSRAKRGNLIIKRVKSTNYKITSAYITDTKDVIGIKDGDNIDFIKNSEISIMDTSSWFKYFKSKTAEFFIKKN